MRDVKTWISADDKKGVSCLKYKVISPFFTNFGTFFHYKQFVTPTRKLVMFSKKWLLALHFWFALLSKPIFLKVTACKIIHSWHFTVLSATFCTLASYSCLAVDGNTTTLMYLFANTSNAMIFKIRMKSLQASNRTLQSIIISRPVASWSSHHWSILCVLAQVNNFILPYSLRDKMIRTKM